MKKLILLFLLLALPLTAFAGGPITYEWDASPGTVDGYKFCGIAVNTQPAPLDASCVDVGSVLTYTVPAVERTTPFCATVYAYDGYSESGPSNTVCLPALFPAALVRAVRR
jgi:hypothetical protein